ncbi:MAG: cellulase family glycosylhydrolase, partial [Acidimicrobiales bacterium]
MSFIACLTATVTLSGFAYVCTAGASGPSVAPIALENLKLVDYFPAGASWTNMWTNFQFGQIQSDFATIKQLGGNAVRLTIDPYTFGWPTVSPVMANEFQEVLQSAENDGLYVQLTLFDWFANYGDTPDSTTWLESFLAPYANDPEIAFIDLQNEIDTSNTQAMTWARAIMQSAKEIAGTIPLTFSISSPEDVTGVQALKTALGNEAPSFYDFHYYGLPGDAASVLAAIKSAVAPAPLFVGEAGMSTYSADGPADEAVLASQEASYYAAVENATASLGLPPAAPWMLNDLVSSGVPYPQSQYPAQWYYGLYTTNGTPKPAAAVVQNFFSTGSEPLLLNAGFEQGANGVPTGWAPTGPSTGTLSWASGTDHSGSYSVEISGSGTQAAWTQVI